MDEKTSGLHTKSGFSRNGFACCSHWNECNMGKGICFYKESDPETMESCNAFQRNNGKKNASISPLTSPIVFSQPEREEKLNNNNNERTKNEKNLEQLSFFYVGASVDFRCGRTLSAGQGAKPPLQSPENNINSSR